MNIKRISAFLIVCSAILFYFGFLIVLTSSPNRTSTKTIQERSNITVSSTPLPAFAEGEAVLNGVPVRETDAATAAGMFPTSGEISAATPTFALIITDEIGYPIEAGNVDMKDRTTIFGNGYTTLPVDEISDPNITVRAEGYQDNHVVLDESAGKQTVVLEYLTDFSVRVLDQNKQPLHDVEVSLYPETAFERPPKDTAVFSVRGRGNTDCVGIRIRRSHREFRVEALEFYVLRTQSIPDMPESFHTLTGWLPSIGDRIIGLSGLLSDDSLSVTQPSRVKKALSPSLNKSLKSLPLRMWDVLSHLNEIPQAELNDPEDFAEFVSHEIEHRFMRVLMTRPKNCSQPLITEKTNANGSCEFSDLPPGMYGVQAVKGSARSAFGWLHSTRTNADLFLKSKAQLTVTVRRKGIAWDLKGLSGVAGVDVTLERAGAAGLYSKATESNGMAVFQYLPFGEYTVVLRKDGGVLSASPAALMVDEPVESVCYQIDDGYEIAGRVIVIDTEEAVRDCPLELFCVSPVGNVVGSIITDQEGRFGFANLSSGQYLLRFPNRFDRNFKYFPVSEPSDGSSSPPPVYYTLRNEPFDLRSIVIEDKSVDDVIVLMEEGAVTRFSGRVVEPDGHPVPGAYLTMLDFRFMEEHPRTDNSGRFQLTLLGKKTDIEFTKNLVATVGQLIPAQLKPFQGKEDLFVEEKEHLSIQTQGQVELRYHAGDVIENIEIVIDPTDAKSIEGIVRTEDGVWPIPVSVFAVQEFMKKESTVDETGRFSIPAISPGPLKLYVRPPLKEMQTASFGTYMGFEYVPESLEIDFPETESKMYVEIVLLRAGYITGTVIGGVGGSSRDWIVRAHPQAEMDREFRSEVQEYGVFFLKDIPLHVPYHLEVRNSNQETMGIMENVAANTENLQIRLGN